MPFLRLTPWKFALALVLFIIASLLWWLFVTARIMDIRPLGFPFQFLLTWGPCPPGQNCSEFKPVLLVLDLVVWYLVSAFALSRIPGRSM